MQRCDCSGKGRVAVVDEFEQHGALRMRTVGDGPQTRFVIDAPSALPAFALPQLDCTGIPDRDCAQAIDQAFASLSEALAPDAPAGMLAACWVERAAPQRALLLVAIHHFAVDGVSWRILLEDLESLTRSPAHGLPAATLPLRAWALALQEPGGVLRR